LETKDPVIIQTSLCYDVAGKRIVLQEIKIVKQDNPIFSWRRNSITDSVKNTRYTERAQEYANVIGERLLQSIDFYVSIKKKQGDNVLKM